MNSYSIVSDCNLLGPTRPTHRRTDTNLYQPGRQLTKASEPDQILEGAAQGQIRPHHKIPST